MNFTEEQLNEIYYKKVKLPYDYFIKHEILPEKCPLSIMKYSWDGMDYPRTHCVLDFQEWIKKYNLEHVEHLAITARGDPELEFVKYTKCTELFYPPYDLHTFNHIDQYDFFIFNQTIEHLHNPFLAVKNIYNSLKPGGYVFTSVPTINIPHSTPIHFNGYNPMGLTLLFMSAKFEVIEIGQWGNLEYIKKLFETHGWPDRKALLGERGSITNEERNVCQCWILAKKPLIQ